ncbi:MAG TPA: CHAT domain-containing protein [Pyrinomonadaceae bacterium]|jgi:hypothetical protein
MAIRCASIVISVEKKESGNILVLKPLGGKPLRAGVALDAAGVREQLKALRFDLDKKFIPSIGEALKNPNWADISEAIHCLHNRGLRLAFQLFGDRCWEVQSLFKKPITNRDDHWTYPKLIQVISPPEGIVPFEFLPLFNLKPPPEITDIRSLTEAARSFIGFSSIVKRTQTNRALSADPVLDNEPKLPIKFFQHVKLAGARKEIEFFRQYSDYIDLEGPWPDKEIPQEQFKQHLAEHLWNPVSRFDSSDREPPDQVQHFSCHCDTTNDLSENHFIRLAHCEGMDQDVTLGELQTQLAGFQSVGARQNGIAFPLVFFNACGTAVSDPMRIGSFPDLLLGIGNRGVIGTECEIPDDFAASFSEQFYRALLGGRPLGDAIYHAKWQMLERHNNPLGILYTVYADPDMYVRNI